jgi:ribonuclease-3
MDDLRLNELEEAIGYRFERPERLLQALTHRSFTEESARAQKHESNEQMEFLGDSILGFLVSESLIERFPEYQEGRLSKLKARLVSAAHLHPVAEQLELGRHLRLGKGEERSGGRKKRALLVDTLEAVVAAVYRDGGMSAARNLVERRILAAVDWDQAPATDYKTELQEWLQERHSPPPRYSVAREQGPEHQKLFTVELRIGGRPIAEAEGSSKKAAEQAAAQIALNRLQENLFELGNVKARG